MPMDEVEKLVRRFKQDHLHDNSPGFGEEEEPRPTPPFVDWASFNFGVGLLITANAITIGLETAARSESDNVSAMWYVLEVVFCLIFVTELLLRLYFHKLAYFGTLGQGYGEAMTRLSQGDFGDFWSFVRFNSWNIFDFIVVMTSVLDTFILMPIGMGGTARFVTMLRFVRLMRLIRLVRLLRMFKELWLVASGLIDAMKTLVWVCGFLFLIIEICAIVTTRAIGHNDELYDPYFLSSGGWDHEVYFKTIRRSMLSLFQIMTFDAWSEDIVRHVAQQQPGMVGFFIAFIAVTSFSMLNVIAGVVIEATLRTANEDARKAKLRQDRERQVVFSQLQEIFQNADQDGSGTLSAEEVVVALNEPEVYNKLKTIEFPVENPKKIFELLDYNDSGDLTTEEFIAGCLRMKGQAKSKDLLMAQVNVNMMNRHCQQFEQEVALFQEKLRLLDATSRALVDHGEHVFLDQREYRKRHPEVVMATTIPRMHNGEIMKAPWNVERQQGGSNAAGATSPQGSKQPALADGPGSPQTPVRMTLQEAARLADEPPTMGMLADGSAGAAETTLAIPGSIPGAIP